MNNANKASNTSAKTTGTILSEIVRTGQKVVGEAIGKDASYISRFKNNERALTLEEFVKVLEALDLELVRKDEEEVKINRDLHRSLVTLSQLGLEQLGVKA